MPSEAGSQALVVWEAGGGAGVRSVARGQGGRTVGARREEVGRSGGGREGGEHGRGRRRGCGMIG